MVIANLSCSVRFNLTGAPALVLTDTTTTPPAGIVGIFQITQPDGYVRNGNIASPDISVAGGSFSFPLTLDSNGQVQCGTYTIVYTATAPGYFSTDFTRTFVFDYVPSSLVLTENFDVFTPLLSYTDSTVYAKAGYTNGAVTRAWSATSTPTGTITGSASTLSLVFGGQYYDANYSITLTSSLLYTNSVNNWLTIQETLTKTVATYAETPPTVVEIVNMISDLKAALDAAINTCQTYDQLKADFEYAQTLFAHIMDKVKVNDMANIYTDLKDLLIVLNNYQVPAYTPTNLPIPPYNIAAFFPGAVWGSITGSITLQTDLVNYVTTRLAGTRFAATIGDTVNTSYTVTHNLNSLDVEVEVVEVSSGETVFADVTRSSVNAVVVSFATAPTLNQYRVIVMI